MARTGVVVSLSLVTKYNASLLVSKKYYREIIVLRIFGTARYAAAYKGRSYAVITTGSYNYKHEIEIHLHINIYTSLVIQHHGLCYKYHDYGYTAIVEIHHDKIRNKSIPRLELADVWADFNIVFSHIGGLR